MRAATWLAWRQVRGGGLVVTGVAAGVTAFVAAGYRQVTADPAAAAGLDALATNPAIRTLFGAPAGLGTAGGFTVWRVGAVTAVLLAAWSILATTRITRGEEDSGRWDLLLSGRMPLRATLIRHLAVVAAVPAATGAAVTAVLLAAGTAPAGALIHGAGTGLLGTFFVAVAAATAQTFAARTPATGTAMAVLGAGLLARMIGDGVAALGWLHWLSPFGLLTRSAPDVHNRALPLLVLAAATGVLAVVAIRLSGHRDVRGGLVPVATARPPRLRWLASVETFAVRRTLHPLAGWMIGIGAYYLLIGLTAQSVTSFLRDNPVLAGAAARAGFDGLGSVAGFVATLFALLAVPVGVFTAVRLGDFVAAESDGRLTLLSGRPVSRIRLLGADVVVTALAAAALVAGAGLVTAAGVRAGGGELPVGAALRGAGNSLPIVMLSLGAAVLAVGWAPRWTGLAGSLPVVGGFLLLVVADSAGAPDAVRVISPFAHLAPVPLRGADTTASVVMSIVAGLLLATGLAGFRRRDLRF